MLFTVQWLLQFNLAAQVWSQTDETVCVGMTILSSLGKLRNEDCMKTEFLQNVNTSFDILNVCAFDSKAASNTLSRAIGIMHKLRKIIPMQILKVMYSSVILPHIYFGITAWGFTCRRVFGLQKKAIRIITKANLTRIQNRYLENCHFWKWIIYFNCSA